MNPFRKNYTLCLLLLTATSSAGLGDTPELSETGLKLTLFAENPDIVTPIGMVVGDDDKVYVIESHTHSPPSDYEGPDGDIVKVFVDEDKDGVADSSSVFAEGFKAGMNLAFSENGVLYILCAWSLYALSDRDGDGVCDEPELILTLDTKAGNPHGCWLGITFDEENNVYISRGNVGSEYYRIEGKDGSVVEGYGDGGNVVRANADGTEVEEWATGFWNSMDLKFDHRGNLLLVDNDPDARGPNRLLKVAEGGDYGYKSMYGGSGRHPFQGWDGSFPGNLPYISGTGEAPSGLLDVSARGEYSILVTVWNENTIERHDIQPDGSVKKSLFMMGGKDFRPVALDQDSDGNLFISDWMLVDYPNHGKGRIWRVSKLPLAKPFPRKEFVTVDETSIRRFVMSDDAFARHQGEMWLAGEGRRDLAVAFTDDYHPKARLGGYLALRRMDLSEESQYISKALGDEDLEVRLLALLWAAESMDVSLKEHLDKALRAGEVTQVLFNTYLAAVEGLDEGFIQSFQNGGDKSAKKLVRKLPDGLVADLARDKDLSAAVRAQAIKRLEASSVVDLLASSEPEILIAAIERTSTLQDKSVLVRITELAMAEDHPAEVRTEALLGLSKQALPDPALLAPLLEDDEADVAYEAARTLRFHVRNTQVKKGFEKLLSSTTDEGMSELAEAALFGIISTMPYSKKRPASVDEWVSRVEEGGNISRGHRVFRTTQAMCTHCHAVGKNLGPDLGGIAQSVSSEQIVRSILRPSESFPPQYQAWNIYTTDGKVHQGLQIDHQSKGAMLLYTLDNENRRFEADEVKDYEVSPFSLMPQGLETVMTVSELRDLVAYLSSLD